ncbi:hypothetical protein GCM10012287_02800 [Streptomyces daqingensis]|uniref:CopG family transcriptional regulator n=1 Tax=Streptomyces daqingensis TaxID=1472640 RepID=A0ABQ2LRI2_9ACTN|nr:hypothetical protein GCM10012287_02800 [Streptomyces daqingensis]
MTARQVSVRRDHDLNDALALLASAGWSTSDAIRYAVRLLADAHEGAWDAGTTQVGRPVEVVAATVQERVSDSV